jgi:adenylosuccinate synthase
MVNNKIVIILSGEIASGKSTLCKLLEQKYDFKDLSSRTALESLAFSTHGDKIRERGFLQKFGENLDKDTSGGWLLNYYQSEIFNHNRIIIDSARIREQIDSFREAYGHIVTHIHLEAPEEVRIQRFKDRDIAKYGSEKVAEDKFRGYKKNDTESNVHSLKKIADLVIHTADTGNPNDYLIRTVSFLKILPRIDNKCVDVVVGGQFGSEGKGQICNHLASEYDCLVRVGGPNAGHKVFNKPEPYTFHLIPSGSVKNQNAKIVIGPGAVINLDRLFDEIQEFSIAHERLIVDENVTVISNRDISWEKKHDSIGSTTQGVGKSTAENILSRLKNSSKNKAINISRLKPFIGNAHEEYQKVFANHGKILLEGTQGTLLSLYHGFYPHVTSRDTTAGGTLAEAGIGFGRVRKILMVVRRYPIRVQSPYSGTSGPFFSEEISYEEIAKRSKMNIEDIETTELTSTTKKPRRIAEFNWALFRKACELNTPTDIAFTFSDYINVENQKARRYDQLSPDTTKFVDELERCSGVPVSLIATRFHYRSIIDRRNWN